jgi:hypothetical protein
VIAAFDFFSVPTLTFRVFYGFLVIRYRRRRILDFDATAHPTSDRCNSMPQNISRNPNWISRGSYTVDVAIPNPLPPKV